MRDRIKLQFSVEKDWLEGVDLRRGMEARSRYIQRVVRDAWARQEFREPPPPRESHAAFFGAREPVG